MRLREDHPGRDWQQVEDRLVRRLTINMALIVIASTSLVIGALTYATGILVALQQP